MKPGAMPGLVIGTISDNEDPENEGRVRANFPWLDDEIETDWFPVAAPFAGNDRGIFFMPHVGDEVVIGFLQGDFNHPVMLGAMWNGQSDAPSEDHRQCMVRSGNGHTIRMVDSTPANGSKGALIIQDAHDNMIVMGNGGVTIVSKGTLQLKGAAVLINDRVVQPGANPL